MPTGCQRGFGRVLQHDGWVDSSAVTGLDCLSVVHTPTFSQLAHPFVAYAIKQHSYTKGNPMLRFPFFGGLRQCFHFLVVLTARFYNTFKYVFGITFGSFEEGLLASKTVASIHRFGSKISFELTLSQKDTRDDRRRGRCISERVPVLCNGRGGSHLGWGYSDRLFCVHV